MRNSSSKALNAKLAEVRLLLCDVDGVLTDGTVFISQGQEFKQFNILDGLGLRLLQMHGVKVGWISNRTSPATRQRAKELKIDFLYQAGGSKVAVVEKLLSKIKFQWKHVCYVGDDLLDLGALKRAGLPVTVSNGVPEARQQALYVTRAAGGRGAVREVAELILKAQKQWDPIVAKYLQ